MNKNSYLHNKIAMYCLSLSPITTIHLINDLYHTHYPLDSTVTYSWKHNPIIEQDFPLKAAVITINNDIFSAEETWRMAQNALIFDVDILEYEIKKRDQNKYPLDLQVCILRYYGLGVSPKKISEKLQISLETVSDILNLI